MLSTLFPPDPTLTVENVGQIMDKVEPKERLQVWKSLINASTMSTIKKKYSTDSEKETAYVDIYVNCDAYSLSLIHISEPTRRYAISYAVFCLKKKK